MHIDLSHSNIIRKPIKTEPTDKEATPGGSAVDATSAPNVPTEGISTNGAPPFGHGQSATLKV